MKISEFLKDKTLEIIKKYYNKANVFITSFIYNALLNVRKLDKTIKIGWLIKEDINQKNILDIAEIRNIILKNKTDEEITKIKNGFRYCSKEWIKQTLFPKLYKLKT
mgnify:CR=1 FL=1